MAPSTIASWSFGPGTRLAPTILFLSLGMLCLTLLVATQAKAGGDGDWFNFKSEEMWVIQQDTHVDNETLTLRHPILVRNNSLLHLDNVTFSFNNPELDRTGLTVQVDSRLVIKSSVLRSTGEGGYYLSLAEGTQGHWQGVEVSGIRSEQAPANGVVIESDSYSIRHSHLHDMDFGLFTSGELELRNNTFHNTSVAIRSSGPLHYDEVLNNTFEWQGYNQSIARFLHYDQVDFEVEDQDGLPVELAWVEGRDENDILRYQEATDSNGQIVAGLVPDEVVELDGSTAIMRNYDLVVRYLSANLNDTLDLLTQDDLSFTLTIRPDLRPLGIFIPAAQPDTFIPRGADNQTAMTWDDSDPRDEPWQEAGWDDDHWSSGALPLGNTPIGGVGPNTDWEGGVAFVRIPFYVPPGTIVHEGIVTWTATTPNTNDRLNIQLNGPFNVVSWQGSNGDWNGSGDIAAKFFQPGENILSLRYQAFTDPFLDVKLELILAREAAEPLVANGTYQALLVLENIGARNALTQIELYVDGELDFSQSRQVPATTTLTRLVTLSGVSAGNHTYQMRLDPDDDVFELNEDNNNMSMEATAFEVGFRVDTAPAALELHTYEIGTTGLQVTNTGEVTDYPVLELEPGHTDWTLEQLGEPPELTPGAQTALSFTLTPPTSEPGGEHHVGLRVISGLSPLASSAWDSFTVEVTVKDSYDLQLRSSHSEISALIGSPQEVELRLFNLGNQEDDFALEMVNLAELEALGWDLTLPATIEGLAADEDETVTLDVNLTISTDQVGTLVIRATSQGNTSRTFDVAIELSNLAYTVLDPLPRYVRQNDVVLTWTIHDPTFVFDDVELFYRWRPLRGTWSDWTLHDEQLKIQPFNFPGEDGRVYEFYTSATLNGGGREPKFTAETNTTVDLQRPRTQVFFHTPWDANNKLTVQTTMNLSWSSFVFPVGSEAGIAGFDLEVKKGNEPWEKLLENTTATSAVFELEPGQVYLIRVRAWDEAGWQELGNSGQNRFGLNILDRPYWARLEGFQSLSINGTVPAWVVLEPGARAKAVQIQYLDDQDQWQNFQRVTPKGNETWLAYNTSVFLDLPMEGNNFMRALVENDTGELIEPGPWELAVLADGQLDFIFELERVPFYDELVVKADPDLNGSFTLTLTAGASNTSYQIDLEDNRLVMGNGIEGYFPAHDEALKATYPAYDLVVERNTEPPLVPLWTKFEVNELTRAITMELTAQELAPGTVFWFERTNDSAGDWVRMHLINLTLADINATLTQNDQLPEGMTYYYRVGVADAFDHIDYSEVKEANITAKPPAGGDNGDDTPPLWIILLLTALGLAIMGGVVAKFKLDQRKEQADEEGLMPMRDVSDLPEVFDGSVAGFAIMSGDAEDGYSIVCRSCGTQRGVTPAQAAEDVTCPGCGQLHPLELDSKEEPPESEGEDGDPETSEEESYRPPQDREGDEDVPDIETEVEEELPRDEFERPVVSEEADTEDAIPLDDDHGSEPDSKDDVEPGVDDQKKQDEVIGEESPVPEHEPEQMDDPPLDKEPEEDHLNDAGPEDETGAEDSPEEPEERVD